MSTIVIPRKNNVDATKMREEADQWKEECEQRRREGEEAYVLYMRKQEMKREASIAKRLNDWFATDPVPFANSPSFQRYEVSAEWYWDLENQVREMHYFMEENTNQYGVAVMCVTTTLRPQNPWR